MNNQAEDRRDLDQIEEIEGPNMVAGDEVMREVRSIRQQIRSHILLVSHSSPFAKSSLQTDHLKILGNEALRCQRFLHALHFYDQVSSEQASRKRTTGTRSRIKDRGFSPESIQLLCFPK